MCEASTANTHTHVLFHFDRTTVHRETLKSDENVLHVH
jgi:hypothetical protein